MAIDLNQVSMEAKAGSYAFMPNCPAIQARVVSTQATAITAPTVVKLVAGSGGVPVVAPCGITEVPFGVIVNSINQESFKANDMVGLATAKDVVYFETTAAVINAGDKVEFTAGGKVLKFAEGDNTILGVSLDSVPATGGIVRVAIYAPAIISVPEVVSEPAA